MGWGFDCVELCQINSAKLMEGGLGGFRVAGAVEDMSKVRKKRSGATPRERSVSSVVEAVSRASSSPFSALSLDR